MRAVVDTNVILVANAAHPEASPDCVLACIERLQVLMRSGHVVIDDAFRILNEYQHKTAPMRNKGPGDVFVRWVLQNRSNALRVEAVALVETTPDLFDNFPDEQLQAEVDASDRKFIAVAAAHADCPPIWQATDCKWLDWWQRLAAQNLHVEFLCAADISCFYRHKFPERTLPALP
jgi:hypothetical protein